MLLKDSGPMSVGEVENGSYSNQAYLFAFATPSEIKVHLRTQAIQEDARRLEELLVEWHRLQVQISDLHEKERGIADTVKINDLPPKELELSKEFARDPVFKRTFSVLPWRFALVEIDRLTAPQRFVNLDHVQRLAGCIPTAGTLADILPLCLGRVVTTPPVQHLEVGPNVHAFSSRSIDLRFLGSYLKDLAPGDVDFAIAGGVPSAAIISFVGYGTTPLNGYQVGGRIILQNGFHRVYALRQLGWKEVPVVLQQVRNPPLEMPSFVASLPREYLLGAPRPVLMGDFFKPEFVARLRIKNRLRVITLTPNANVSDVPG